MHTTLFIHDADVKSRRSPEAVDEVASGGVNTAESTHPFDSLCVQSWLQEFIARSFIIDYSLLVYMYPESSVEVKNEAPPSESSSSEVLTGRRPLGP